MTMTWYECVKDDMKVRGLHPEWAVFRDMWRGFISGGTSIPERGKIDVLKINDDDDDDDDDECHGIKKIQ